jgi:hypothetical protein
LIMHRRNRPGAPIIGLLRSGRAPLLTAADFQDIAGLAGEPLVLVDRTTRHLERLAGDQRMMIAVHDSGGPAEPIWVAVVDLSTGRSANGAGTGQSLRRRRSQLLLLLLDLLFAQSKQHCNLGQLCEADQVAGAVVELGQVIGPRRDGMRRSPITVPE